MNILYIDFNSIIYPSIRLYKNFFDENASAEEVWEYLNQMMNISDFIYVDANMVKQIAKILKKNTSAKKVFLKNDYQRFVSDIQGIKSDIQEGDSLNLTYMSFFNHFWDTKESKNDIVVFQKYGGMSFIGYLIMNEVCDKVTWAKAPNSDVMRDEDTSDVEVISMTSDEILGNDYDDIYLYNSPFFLPHKYQYIYDTFETIFGED